MPKNGSFWAFVISCIPLILCVWWSYSHPDNRTWQQKLDDQIVEDLIKDRKKREAR